MMAHHDLSKQNASAQTVSETESAQQLAAIIEHINGGVSVAVLGDGGQVRLAYANERYYALMGYTKEQFLAELKAPHDVIFPADADYVRSMIEDVKKTRQAATFKYRIICRGGRVIHVRCSSSMASINGLGSSVLLSVVTDITDSVSDEQQALVIGQRLTAVMDNISNGVTACTIGEDGTVDYVFVTDKFFELLGYTRAQFCQEVADPFALILSEDAERIKAEVKALTTVGQVKDLRFRARRRDGQVIWLRDVITVMRFADVEAPVQLSVFTDISTLMAAEEMLRSQHSQMAELMNATPAGISVVEVDARDILGTMHTTYYNDHFFSYSGYSREEYDALLRDNELRFMFEEDVPALLEATERMCRGAVGTSVDCTVRCHTKSGGYRWLLLTGELAQRQGEKCVIYIVMVDITDRKEAEDRERIREEMLRIAAETDKRALVLYDIKANTCRVESRTLFSANYGEVFSNVPDSLLARGIAAPESTAELRQLFARIRRGEQKICVSLLLHTGEEEYQWFECNATVVFDVDKQPDHAVLVLHNITEQRIKEAVFKKWQQSIDTRSPESYTLYRCNLSRNTTLDEQDGKLLKIKFDASSMTFNERTREYASQYVFPDDRQAYEAQLDGDTLLAMFYRGEHTTSREYREIGENGALLWRRVTIEMVEYLNSTDVQAFLLYEDIDEQKRAELREKELAETDPLTGALNRVTFSNRVEGAITQEAGAQHALLMMDIDGFKLLNDSFGHAVGDQALTDIAAILRSLVRSGDLICRLGGDEFLVWLQGIPYDAIIEKIVRQICHQVRKAFSLEVQISASVGIAVYPRDGHNFDELYRSADKAMYKVKQTGKDSYLFASSDDDPQPDGVKPEDGGKTPLWRAAKTRRRMLIVDDSEATRMMLSALFKDEYLIELAKSGADAMMRLRHFGSAISIVLLDLSMPGMDGFDVLNRMQNNVEMKTIPVIVVSADEGYDTNLKAIECGAADYVTKPVDPNLIRLRVQSAISRAENERLRAQNSYLQLQRDEELKYHTVLESTGTVVIEYSWRNHVFIYDNTISQYLAGTYNSRGLWQIFLSDMVAASSDVKALQDMMLTLANDREQVRASRLVMLATPSGAKHWFRMNVYKQTDDFGLAEKMIITFNDIHEEVLTNEKLLTQATRDELTGLCNRIAFIERASQLIAGQESGYYVMSCIDIENFKVINDQYGVERGDEILRHVADDISRVMAAVGGICCRYTADNFGMLYPVASMDSEAVSSLRSKAATAEPSGQAIKIRIGRYIIDDLSLPVGTMYDRATLAEESIRGRYDTNIAYYDSAMSEHILHEQRIVTDMDKALTGGEFQPWLQPQYNHATGAIIGAEALVRWKKDGKFISPAEFIPVFERNGFIYEMDLYIWEQVCRLLRRWLDEGREPLPVSVNISRRDLFHADFIPALTGLVKKYDIPTPLLRLEVTESAFAESSGQVVAKVDELIALGFTLEIDDFGSGYSSLNTLKDVPATILKLDMKFFETSGNSQRGGNIVESVVRMAKWLGMAVIAEGVEDKEQADYLKSIGCYYIQGFYYAKPMPVADYEKLLDEGVKEPKLTHLQTLETLDNNEFWNPKSMETLIFNSYVGGACIFEFCGGKSELLRMNDQYTREFGGIIPADVQLRDAGMVKYLTQSDREKIIGIIRQADTTHREAACEVKVTDGRRTEYIRFTVRVIARSGERLLCYGVVLNMTEQRKAEMKEHNTSVQMQAILANMRGGVTASVPDKDGRLRLIFANNRFYEMYGYTKAQYDDEVDNVVDLIHPDDRKTALEAVERILREGGADSYEMRCIRRDGSILWQQINNSVVTLEGYQEPVLLALHNDISVLRLAQQAASAASDKLRAVMNHAGNGITAIALREEKTEFLFANDAYFDIIGYTRENYAKATAGDMLAPVHPDDREALRRLVTRFNAIREGTSTEYRVVREDGRVVWVRSAITITELQGVDVPVQIAVFSDITAEKDANRQLQFLNDAAHEILAQPDTAQAIDRTLHSLMDYFAGQRAYVMELDYARRVTDNTCEVCAPGVTSEKDSLQGVPFAVSQYWFDTLNQHQFVVIEDVEKLGGDKSSLRDILRRQNIRSLIIAPLWRDGVLVGYVGVDNPTRAVEQLDRLAALGDYIAILLTRRDLRTKIDSDHEMMLSLMNDTPGGFVRMKLTAAQTFVPVFANDGFARMLGMSHEKLRAIYGQDVLAGVHPDDREIVRRAGEQMVRCGSAESARFRVHSGSGEDVWLTMYGRMTKDASGDTYLNVYYTDVSRQMREEQGQRALLDNLPSGAALYEYDGENISVIHINKRYWELVGRQPVDYADASILDAVHPDDRVVVAKEIQAAIRQNRGISVNLRILCGQAGYKPFQVCARITPEGGGRYLLYASYTPVSQETLSMQEMLPVALSTVMSASDDYSYVKDSDLRYICCSRSDAEIMGLASERDGIGKTDRELFSPEIAALFEAEDRQVLESGKPIIERREKLALRDDTIITVSASKYPVTDADGRVIGIYGVSRNVTKEMQQASQLEPLTASIPGGLATFLCDGGKVRLTYCNNGFCQLFGVSKDDYLRQTAANSLWFILEQDRPVLVEQYHALLAEGTPIDCIYRIRMSDGAIRWIHHRAAISEAHGGKTIVNAALLDITRQQEEKERLATREEEYRLATEHSGQTICRYNIADHALTFHADMARRLGLPDCLEGVPYERVKLGKISPETANAYIAFYEAIMRGEKECTVTFQKLLPNGWRWVTAHATTIFTENGKPLSAIISYVDVTEQQEKEAVYRKWQQSLQARTPASYTLYRANLSRDVGLDTREGSLLDYLPSEESDLSFNERTAEFAQRYVFREDRRTYTDFLNADALLAGYSRGKRSGSIDFRGILPTGVLHWLRLTVELVEYPHSREIQAYLLYEDINEEKLEQIQTRTDAETDPLTGLLNRKTFAEKADRLLAQRQGSDLYGLFLMDLDGFKLINDSFGHSVGDQALIDAGNVITSVLRERDLVCRMGGDEFLVLLTGMPSRDAILKKAKKLVSLTHKSFNLDVRMSISLGIALCPEDGASFDELYRKADQALYHVKDHGKDNCAFYSADMSEPPQPKAQTSAHTSQDGEPSRRILVVDDSQSNRLLLTNIFKDEFTVDTVDSGGDALTYLRRNRTEVAAILLDLVMPGMDGFTVLEKLRSSAGMDMIPVVVVSGADDRETSLKAIRAGASDFVTKPVDADLLRIRVASAISKAENQQLRLQNHYLTMQKHEAGLIRSLFENEGIMLAEYDKTSRRFRYDTALSQHIAGPFDRRPLWEILSPNAALCGDALQTLRQAFDGMCSGRERHSVRATLRLRTPSGAIHTFRVKLMLCGEELPAATILVAFADAGEEDAQPPRRA